MCTLILPRGCRIMRPQTCFWDCCKTLKSTSSWLKRGASNCFLPEPFWSWTMLFVRTRTTQMNKIGFTMLHWFVSLVLSSVLKSVWPSFSTCARYNFADVNSCHCTHKFATYRSVFENMYKSFCCLNHLSSFLHVKIPWKRLCCCVCVNCFGHTGFLFV